jgi:hypothetical protein
MAEHRLVEEHALLLPSRQVGKSLHSAAVVKGVYTIAIDTCKPDERLLHLLASHALDGVTPETFDTTDNRHRFSSP